jgi:undecaprenyl diphosphate synthase
MGAGSAFERVGEPEVLSAIPLGEGLHVGAIMDGNGRWATRRGLPRIAGHAAGEEAVDAIVEEALRQGVTWLTVFAFSTENWNRPQSEVDFLMDFNRRLITSHGSDYHARNIRVRYLGASSRVPEVVTEAIRSVEELTENNTGLNLTFAFNHGGRDEIVTAARELVTRGVDPGSIDEKVFAEHLPVNEMPDPDLIIRTSGEFRISNFLLWRAAYAEFVFLDVLWPDFRGEHLRDALRIFHARTRRFGAVSEDRLDPAGAEDEINAVVAGGIA